VGSAGAEAWAFTTHWVVILTVAPTGAQLAQDPLADQTLLTDACQEAVKDFKVNAVVLGGAGLAELAA
jgi:allantoin racemase